MLKNIVKDYIMDTLETNVMAKSGNRLYYCQKCDYQCCKKYNWDKHIMTARHMNDYKRDNLVAKSGKKWQTQIFTCDICDKKYQYRQNLWRHNKKCYKFKEEPDKNDKLIEYLMKENKEMKDLILEIVKNGTHNTNTTNNTTNSNNKAFNLNFFLNETCKNAMNITDFVDSIKLQLTDLEKLGEIGYVEGISNIILNNLNNLDETVRPVHCTDKKRETMYVKDEGEWEKEDDEKTKLKKAISKIADKNIRLLPQFREKYPEYCNSSSNMSDKYDKMVIEVMETDNEKDAKIIRNISKATLIKDKFL